MRLPTGSVCLYGDGAQNPVHFERGLARYVVEQTLAIHALAPSVLRSVSLNPGLPLTGNLSSLLGTGLLSWSTARSPADGRSGRPLIYHVMSPFEDTSIDVMWPHWARDSRVATVVTLYDLIPLIFADQYLQDPYIRAFYDARLDLIRHADQVLAISQVTAEDAIERLKLPAERVHVIHAGASEHFAGMYESPAAAWSHLERHLRAVRRGFILYVGGFDFRKNLEGMIAGYGRLPASVRAQHQLVIACRMQPAQRDLLGGVAEAAGIAAHELLLTGYVSDSDLGALYRACSLFVFPSLYEGSGLPMLEAMSCGAPVAAGLTSTSPEILGDREATFDPSDPDSIASCLHEVMGSDQTLERLRERSRRRAALYTWRRVAEHSLEAYERGIGAGPKRRAHRPRIALVTPWPPEQCTTAAYSYLLATELGHRADVDVVVAQELDRYAQPLERGVRLLSARVFAELDGVAQHDRVLYCMGSSPAHRHVHELLLRRPGAVLLHDVRLAEFYAWDSRQSSPEDPMRAFEHRIRAMYPTRAVALDGGDARAQWRAWGFFMSLELQSHAEECYVHSRFARDVLDLDRGALELKVPISVLPRGVPQRTVSSRGVRTERPLIISLGSISEPNGMASLISAFGSAAGEFPEARLVIADPDRSDELERWQSHAAEHAPSSNVEFLEQVSDEHRSELLASADLAVQLRCEDDAESSGTIADCLSYGLPMIVTDLGWPSELPEGAVAKIELGVEPDRLSHQLQRLLADADERRSLSETALAHASACSFTRVADAYFETLGLG